MFFTKDMRRVNSTPGVAGLAPWTLQRAESVGVIHPLIIREDAFDWMGQPDIQSAIISGILSYELNSPDTVSESKVSVYNSCHVESICLPATQRVNEEYAIRIYEDVVVSKSASELPQALYHPADAGSRTLPSEARGAFLARALGFSVVVLEFETESVGEFVQGGNGAAFKTRWSMGTQQELYRPLHIGMFP